MRLNIADLEGPLQMKRLGIILNRSSGGIYRSSSIPIRPQFDFGFQECFFSKGGRKQVEQTGA